MKIQEINSTGTLAVVLPKNIVEKLRWKKGDNVEALITESANKITLINIDKV